MADILFVRLEQRRIQELACAFRDVLLGFEIFICRVYLRQRWIRSRCFLSCPRTRTSEIGREVDVRPQGVIEQLGVGAPLRDDIVEFYSRRPD